LLIADTGVESPTRAVVGAVRSAWQESKDRYEALFDEVGDTVVRVRDAMEKGDAAEVGRLMDENHRLLRAMEVSSSQLDALVNAAKRHGALGAKLSGAGRGGNMIALTTPESCQEVKEALQDAGAQGVLQTEVKATTDVTRPLAPFMASPSQQ
jgi:mevalonate kinase